MDDTLKVVGNLLGKIKPNAILEIGTAVGYSAICFSEIFVRRWNNRYYRKRSR